MKLWNPFRAAKTPPPLPPPTGPTVNRDVQDRWWALAVASTEEALSGALMQAGQGDPRYLWSWYVNRMRPGWPHLEAEIDRAETMVSGARAEALACPASLRSRSQKKTGDAALAADVASYCGDVLIGPAAHLGSAAAALMTGYWTGVGAFQYWMEPDGKRERIAGIERVSPHRFRLEVNGTRLLVQATKDFNSAVPIEDLQPGLVVFAPDRHIPDPGRWGSLIRLLPYFMIHVYGPEWWSRAVERYGEPPRVGWYPKGDLQTRDQLISTFQDPGSALWLVLPEGAKAEFFSKLVSAGDMPHRDMLDWTNREASKLILGSTQTSDVEKNTGSKSSASVHQDVVLEKAESRAKRIATCLREQFLVPLVSRAYGPEIAAKHTPELVFYTKPKPSLLEFATAIKALVEAGGGEAIPLSVINEEGGIPVPEGDEPTLKKAPPPVPIIVPPGAPPPDPEDKTEPPEAPGEMPDPEDMQEPPEPAGKQAASRARAKDDPAVELERLEAWALRRADKAGEEILAPYRGIINQAQAEGASLEQLFHRVLQRAGMPLDSPELLDLLAAVQYEGVMRGFTRERKPA
jgi:hypothetical protein